MEKCGSSLFREGVRAVEPRGDIFESEEVPFDPVEDGVVANVDVPRLSCRLACSRHHAGTTVVFEEECGVLLGNVEFVENGTKVESHPASIAGSDKFGFRGGQGDGRLYAGFPGNGGTSQDVYDTRDGPTMTDVHGPVAVNIAIKGIPTKDAGVFG